MDIFSLLSYINKVSLLAFFVTTAVVAYQIYVMRKEKTKEKTPAIPNFDDLSKSSGVINYTSLPSTLTKKDKGPANYSKLIFLVISVLTVMVIGFIFVLIRQNSSFRNQALVNPATVISPAPARKFISPTPKVILTPTLTATLSAELLSPTATLAAALSPSPAALTTVSPTVEPSVTSAQTTLTPTVSLTVAPTEIILAQAPSSTPALSPTDGQKTTGGAPKVLPETGSWEKGFLIIGVAISTIFFSFWF